MTNNVYGAVMSVPPPPLIGKEEWKGRETGQEKKVNGKGTSWYTGGKDRGRALPAFQ